MSVEGTGDVWFINFYSTQCSYCHELAPTWRDVARDLFGVIRIGAVDCAEEWDLCQQNGIDSYPTLLIYPQRERYDGDHSRGLLVRYALESVRTRVLEVRSDEYRSYFAEAEDPEMQKLPWLISLCMKDEECWQRTTVMKLAAMQSVKAWHCEFQPSHITSLETAAFRSIVLNSKQPWIVEFYAPWCDPCHDFAPVFEEIAQKIKSHVSAGKINCDLHQRLCQEAGVLAYPSLRFYRGADLEQSQALHGEQVNILDTEFIIEFLSARVQDLQQLEQNFKKEKHKGL